MTEYDVEQLAVLLADDPKASSLLLKCAEQFYYTFRPRPDNPERFDQQQSFVEDMVPGVAGLLGGNACLGGEQELYDPVARVSRRVDQISGWTWTTSFNRTTGVAELSMMSPPFVKGESRLFRIHLSSGESFVSTLGHRVLCQGGEWKEAGELRIGDRFQASESHVTAIEFVREDTFYDVHVPGNNNYFCAGVVHSNSGTSEASAFKLAQFVLNRQPPPRKDTPFWIVGPKIDQTIQTFWKEKLHGHGHVPAEEIDWNRIRWWSEKQALPSSVPLLPWPKERGGHPDKNWCLTFRSFAEGAGHLTAESIGGFCLTEPFPQNILTEIVRATREYNFPGSRFFELTPVDPALTYWLEEMIIEDTVPDGWKIYRCNTMCNAEDERSVVSQDWADDFFAMVSSEQEETRKTGAFASYEGIIYQTFNRLIHVVDDMPIPMDGVIHKRAADWGASEEHPFAFIFAYKDPLGVWNIYGEYYTTDQTMVWADHCEVIKEMYPFPSNDPAFQQTYADPSRPDLIKEFNNNGIPISPANNSVYEGIESVRRCLKIQKGFGPRLRIASWCKQTIKEFLIYRWMRSTGRGVNPQAAKPVPLKRWDDCMDAVRYLIHTDYRSSYGGVKGYRTEPRQRPQVRHKRLHGRT